MNAAQSLPFTSDPILVIDKQNLLGSWLYPFLNHDSLTVLVSAVNLSDKALVHLQYSKKMPKIPDTRYEAMYFVWSGEKSELTVLPQFMEKARNENTNFVFIVSYAQYNPTLANTILSQHKKSYVFVIGDLFGEHPLSHPSRVVTLLAHAKREHALSLSQMGLTRIYPVTYEDTARTIVQTVSSGALYAQQLLVFPKLSLTELALARILQKIDSDLQIDFHDAKNASIPTTFLQQGKFLLDDDYQLLEKFKQALGNSSIPLLHSAKQAFRVRQSVKKPVAKPIGRVSKTAIISLFYLMLLLLFMPFLGTVGFSMLGTQALITAKDVSQQGSALSAIQLSRLAQTSFSLSDSFGSLLFLESKLVYKDADVSLLLEQIHSDSRLSQSMVDALTGESLFMSLLSGKASDPSTTLLSATNALKSSILEVQSVQESGYISSVFASELHTLQPVITSFSTFLNAFPSLLGMKNSASYLVLVDNALQLRPGGGVVNAYGVVTLNKGKIEDFHLAPVDTSDSKIKGQSEMPFAFRRYGGMTNVTLKNGLFDIDFSRNAKALANVFADESGTHVDGVITLDTTFLQQVVKLTGPIIVDGVSVSADNFYTSMQSHPLFLSHFADALFSFLKTKPALSLPVSTAIVQAVHEKHVLAAFSDIGTQNVFTVGGGSSSLWDGREVSPSRFNDFLGISETNLGTNDANFFMQRSLSQHISIAPDASYSAQTTILYHNTAQQNASDGNYLMYLRILLPETALVSSISFGDQIQHMVPAITDVKEYTKKDFKAPKGLEVDTATDSGKKSIGFFVPIPAGTTKVIKISYTQTTSMPFVKQPGAYSLQLFKQPGVDTIPYSFQLAYPASLKTNSFSAGISNEGTTLSALDLLTSDTDLEASFTKN